MSNRGEEICLRNSEFTLSEILSSLEGLSQAAVNKSAALAAKCRGAAQVRGQAAEGSSTAQERAQAAADAAMQELLVRVSAVACMRPAPLPC
jgi:hypothetical protein